MRRAAVVSIVLVAAAGCTMLSGVGDLEATGDGDGGGATAEAGATADGSVSGPGRDGAIPTDANTSDADASAPVDASDSGVDAGPIVDAGKDAVVPPSSFCDGVPASVEVCLDYDSKSLNPATVITSGSTLTVDSPGVTGNSLHCVGKDDQNVDCQHVVALPKSPGKVRLQFRILVEELGSFVEFDEIKFQYAGAPSCTLQPALTASNIQINEYCPDYGLPDQVNHNLFSKNGLGVGWYSFDVTLDFSTRSFSGTITQPGASPAPFAPIILDDRFVTSDQVELHAGLTFSPKHTPGAKIRTDNITVDILP